MQDACIHTKIKCHALPWLTLMVYNCRMKVLMIFMATGHVLQPRTQFWKFSVLTGKLCFPLSSFTWHLVTIRRDLTGLFWIVWKLFGTEQCLSTPPVLCRRLSHPEPDVSTGTMYQSLVATLSLVYTAPWIWQQSACFQTLSPSLLLHPLTFFLKGLASVCVGWVGGDVVTKSMVPLWKASWFRRPMKTEGRVLLGTD